MDENSLKIPKRPVAVALWVHPEGRVMGSIFLHLPTADSCRGEQPLDVMNEKTDFLVIVRDPPEAVRFYNKSSIVRVDYRDDAEIPCTDGPPLPCRITMMDGSVIDGALAKAAPVERSRLYDCMNDTSERFLKLLTGSSEVTLVNKSYIVYITPADHAPAESGATDGAAAVARGPLELAA